MPPPRSDLTQPRKKTPAPTGFDPSQKRKIIILSVMIAVLLVWVGFFLFPMLTPKKVAKEPQSAGWLLAKELNEALAAERTFHDTAFVVESEQPLKLKLRGLLKSPQDLTKLQDFILNLKPELSPQQFEYEVEFRR